MIKPTTETALHAAGLAVTALAAHTAVGYLQTYSPDLPTAYGFSLAISAAVFGGWTYTFNSRTLKRGIPLAIASLLVTAISGYTVYQAGLMPLQAAAKEAATEADKPRMTEHQRTVDQYTVSAANLQTQINDLRKQNATTADEKAKIEDGKGADWKRAQLQKSIDTRTKQITEMMEDQAKQASPGEFQPSAPKAIPAEQTLPIFARAFAFELIMIMFMLFARLSRDDKARATRKEALELVAITSTTNRMIEALKTQLSQAEKASRELAASMERRATAAKETASKHLTAEIQHMEKRAKEAGETLQKDINETTRTLERLLAHADKRANTSFARANECANSTNDGLSQEQVINLLKNRLLEPSKKGNFTPEIIMEKAGVGMPKAKAILKELAENDWLEAIPAGLGFTYRYPQPSLDNVFKLRSAS